MQTHSYPTPAAIPLYFGPAERCLFGWYHPPATAGAQRDSAVVLCRPLGYEAVCTDATYRYLAERLAEAGYPVLRFDYDGTGDSFGSDDDGDRLRHWQDSIGFAIDKVRKYAKTDDITLFGVRFGATLAALAASERGDVNRLILWAGFPNGRSYLRERRALQGAGTAPTASYEEAAGFMLTSDTVAELQKIDLSSLTRRPALDTLLIDRDDLPAEKRLGERLAALGTSVTRVRWPGYAAMMRDTQETEIPIAAIDSMIGWLNESVSLQPKRVADLLPESGRLNTRDYTEEPIRRGSQGESFGVLTSPRTRNKRSRTAVLLLSVGANPHIGPNRMYVTLARQLAAHGFPVLRLDIPGVGDSARGAATGRQAIYSAEGVADVRDALSHLEVQTGAKSFVLVGLCSGAYIAFQAASEDARVRAQVLINPQTFEWHEGDSLEIRMKESYKQTRLYLNSLGDAHTLKRVVRGQVNIKGISGALLKRSLSHLSRVTKNGVSLATRLRAFETPVFGAFRRITERGTDTFFIFADQDFGLEVMSAHLGPNARRIRGQHKPRIEIIGSADHTFTPKAARDRLLSSITDHLSRLFPADA